LAGYETTASTLSFCTYELALHPEVQDKLYAEVTAVADKNGDIDYETLVKLPYIDAVLSETLRKYPPVARLERRVSENYTLGGEDNGGIKLYKGQIVDIPAFAIHHCEDYYENPEKFDPERFMPENRHKIKPYTYLPFGAGPRNCIGLRFALLEAKLSLSKLIQKYRFVRSENTDVPLKFKPSGLLQVDKVMLKIQKR
jgi:cytochrome P450